MASFIAAASESVQVTEPNVFMVGPSPQTVINAHWCLEPPYRNCDKEGPLAAGLGAPLPCKPEGSGPGRHRQTTSGGGWTEQGGDSWEQRPLLRHTWV